MAIPNSFEILQAVIEATPDAIFVKDLDGRYVLVNEAAARFLNKAPAEIVGKHDLELYPEETARRFMADDQKVMASGEPQAFEGEATGDGGRIQAYLVTKGVYRDKAGQIRGLFGISHDITELRHAQQTLEKTREALFRAQKLEAVGQLTGGIAHDFNNILTVLVGSIEVLRLRLRGDAAAKEILDTAMRAALHGRDLTGQLLAFSRRRLLAPRSVDINACVADIVKLLSRTLGATIAITIRTSEDAGVAFVDPAALEAALLNVALNARDAMPTGGSLTIRTGGVTITRPPASDDDLKPGRYAVLEIEDTGIGMPPDVAARVFEPFFTTKAHSGGTGLGLSMVYGFAQQSGGAVTIASEPQRGTVVRLFLPASAAEAQAAVPAALPRTIPSVSRKILLVEDDDQVRNIVLRQLESLGHRVSPAKTADEALPIIHGADAPDLLVTDVVLGPGMNGVDLAQAARSARPNLAIVFMSGYTAVPEAPRILETGAPLLMKPFTTDELERAVNEVRVVTSSS